MNQFDIWAESEQAQYIQIKIAINQQILIVKCPGKLVQDLGTPFFL
jgi:hypothetical protein